MKPKFFIDFDGVRRRVDRHLVQKAGIICGLKERAANALPLKTRLNEEQRNMAVAARCEYTDQLILHISAVEHVQCERLRVVKECTERYRSFRQVIRRIKLRKDALHERERLRKVFLRDGFNLHIASCSSACG